MAASSSSERRRDGRAHVLLLPYPSQGHINPMLQFSKRLISKGLTATFAYTRSIYNSLLTGGHLNDINIPQMLQFDTISDGYDEGGFSKAESIDAYLARFRDHGSKTLSQLIERRGRRRFDFLIYDAFMPWAMEVAKHLELPAAAFFTQPCAVNYIYYRSHHGLVTLPTTTTAMPPIPGLPPLDLLDMPSFFSVPGSYFAYYDMVLNQFSNAHEADCLLVNTFYELEPEVIDLMSQSFPNPLLAIGPTIPSIYLDDRVENDNDYGVNLYKLDPTTSLNWLSTKPAGSVVYASFGSMASLEEDQYHELASALKAIANSSSSFLWVIRESEAEKLPEDFKIDDDVNGLIVSWSPQLKVLASEAIGCFLTHCGWNSTTEALSLGVPMVVIPQWTDQPTNAKLVEDVWRVGVRVKKTARNGKGIAKKEDIERCIREVMGGEKGKKMKENATNWKELSKKAVDKGGSSDFNIDQFVFMIDKIATPN